MKTSKSPNLLSHVEPICNRNQPAHLLGMGFGDDVVERWQYHFECCEWGMLRHVSSALFDAFVPSVFSFDIFVFIVFFVYHMAVGRRITWVCSELQSKLSGIILYTSTVDFNMLFSCMMFGFFKQKKSSSHWCTARNVVPVQCATIKCPGLLGGFAEDPMSDYLSYRGSINQHSSCIEIT